MSIKNLPKQVIILSLVSLFTDIASEMLYPVTPIFMSTVLGASMAVIGLLEGVAEVVSGFFKGYFGVLSDKVKKRAIFISLGYGLSTLSKPLPGIFPSLAAIITARISDRLGKGLRTAPRDALLASYANGNSGAVFGFHRGMDTLGAAIGPALALLLLAFFPKNYTLIFLIAFVPSMIAVSFTFFVKDNFISKEGKKKIGFRSFLKTAPKEYKLVLGLIVLFSFANSSDVFLILKSKAISGSETLAILSYIFYNLVYAASSYPLGRLSDKVGKKNIFTFGLFIFSVVYFGFAVAHHFVFAIILFAMYGVYAAATEGITKAWVSDLVPDEQRGTAIGLLTMLSSFAIMFGSFIAGILWDAVSPSAPFYFSGSVALLLAVLTLIGKKSLKR
ncbi:MAG: MFS transporter [Ignavibacteriaceae bacterium]|jgi:MFS family permease